MPRHVLTIRYNLLMANSSNWQRKIILEALEEDLGPKGDITSDLVIPSLQKGLFELVAKEDLIVFGLDVCEDVFKLVDKNISVKKFFKDGNEIKKNKVVIQVSGKTINILKAERTALNFISHLSGIATLTKEMTDLIKDKHVTLLDTRKTTPNLRLFEKKAVLSGGAKGAKNHRFNLSEMILIKDNHIAACGSVKNAISAARKKYNGKSEKLKLEVEVSGIKELKEAISCNPDVIMFDNWNVKDLRDAVKLVPEKICTEASGLITPQNIKNYSLTGVNCISTSYMIKNARWMDFSLELKTN